MSKEKIIVEGFAFENEKEAEQARKEVDGVSYIQGKVDMDDPEMVLQIYNKIIEQELFETVVGQEYLKKLQEYLYSIPFVEQGRILSIPVKHPQEEDKPRRREIPVTPKKSSDKNVGDRNYKRKFEIMAFVASILLVCVIAMFVITATANNVTILNYESELIDKYEHWEQELSEREAAISLKEEELGIGQN